MKQNILKLTGIALTTSALGTTAIAGGIERTGNPASILFNEGNYLEFAIGSVDPSVSGVTTVPFGPFPAGTESGTITDSFVNYSLGYKHQLNDKLSLAFNLKNPVGADVEYAEGTGYFFAGSSATIDSRALTGLLRYNFTDRFSVYGGITLQELEGEVRIRALAVLPTYDLDVGSDTAVGYVAGLAYEIPDIALRVALTYESEIEHSFDDNLGASFDVVIPQAVTLDFQTGVSPSTLVFGSVRWREWTAFDVSPPDFAPFNPIASGTSDVYTYTLGVGHKFNDNWSGALILGHERDQGDIVGNLSGTDGYNSLTLALTYTQDNWKITGGVTYAEIGSATTSTIGSDFSDNDVMGFGIKVGYSF